MKNLDEQTVTHILTTVMEFMIQELTIEGQVENYVMLISLLGAGTDERSVIML
jgi:hypothetical protein